MSFSYSKNREKYQLGNNKIYQYIFQLQAKSSYIIKKQTLIKNQQNLLISFNEQNFFQLYNEKTWKNIN